MRIEIDKQQTKRIIVHFSCQEREKKEKNISNQSPTTIQLLFVYTRHTMLKNAWLRV